MVIKLGLVVAEEGKGYLMLLNKGKSEVFITLNLLDSLIPSNYYQIAAIWSSSTRRLIGLYRVHSQCTFVLNDSHCQPLSGTNFHHRCKCCALDKSHFWLDDVKSKAVVCSAMPYVCS
jgi:hypothetical protein